MTTTAIPSLDVNDFKSNIQDFDRMANGTGTYTDRFGDERLTLDEFMRRNGYEVPVAFASGIAVSRTTQTVTYSGVTYHALATAIPFTTTGTFNPAQWEVISGVSREELAAEYGGSLIGAATYAQLRAYAGSATRMHVGGRSSYFDNCNGIFVRSGTAADNDGTVLKDALNRSWVRQFSGPTLVRWFGATADWNGTTGTDNTAIFNAVITLAEAAGGGVVEADQGFYLCSSGPVVMKRGVELRGQGSRKPGALYDGVTVLYGKHTGTAVLSAVGAHCTRMVGITLYGDPTTTPKTGLLLGRSSSASAGLHYIERVHADGYYTKAAIYSIASESNVWIQPAYTLRGGGALYGFYTSQGDDLGVGGLTGSSNLENTIVGMEGINMVDSASASGIYLNGGASTGTWAFQGCYAIQFKGAYVTVASGYADGSDTLGPITFVGCGGEIYNQAGGGTPLYGYNIIGSGTTATRGLTITGGRFQFIASTGNERSIKQTGYLKQPNINLQTMDAATAEFDFSKITAGYVNAGSQSITLATLQNGWLSTTASANGFQLPGYYRDPFGWVHLVGVANGGTTGLSIFTLPAGYRPASSELFTVANGSTTNVRLDVKTDGSVLINAAGSNVLVSLSGISFKAA